METSPSSQNVVEGPGADPARSPAQRLQDLRRMLRRRWLVIAVVVLATTASALATSLTSPDRYDATAKLLLRDSEPIEALLGLSPGGGSSDPERETNTKVALIKLETVADRVADRVGLNLDAQQLLDQVTAEVEGTSDIIAITVRDTSPRRAAVVANAFAREYVAFRRRSARASIDEAAALARTQLDSLDPGEAASREGRQLEARLRELEIASSLQTGGAEVVRRATVPTARATPRPLRTAVLGLFLGLLLGGILALLLEFVDRRLKDEEEAQATFELPILATIPKPTRAGANVVLNGDREVEEGFGTLAANLAFANRARQTRVVMVTSPRSGDGKTSVALGVARALRTLGQRVIVVEADLHHPRFVHIFNIEQRGGLSSLLAGVSDIQTELIALDTYSRSNPDKNRSNGAPSFSILPAGPVPPNPSAMLTRPAMAAVVDQCRQLADVVLIDTAPVGLVHDPLTLVNHVDAVIVVSRLQWTTRDAARRTLRLLGQVGGRILGVVLTGGERSPGYYGDPDYRHYGRPKPKEREKEKRREKPVSEAGTRS